ncbi:prepilin peptidase [uncultured Sphingomonas sp.]|uniref:prepilin peptidase n=1 Tax=uncultured Sphingomonas sp. TaxID=158754 RepID=UPI0035CBBBA7
MTADPPLLSVAWPALLAPLLLAGAGLIAGSFLATLVIRWPEGRSVARGRSACDGCGRALTAPELVPLLSAAVTRGRCRTCGAAIDPRHWRIEAGCAAVGALAGWAAPGWAGVAGAVFGWLLLALAALDAADLWLPDALVLPLALAGLATGAAGLEPPLAERLIGGVVGYGVLRAIGAGYRHWRGREGLGGGDPKLLGAIGLWLGWRMLPWVLVVASVAGLLGVGIARLRGRPVRADTPVPLGALMAAAAYPIWLVMIAWQP